ncbi:MAG: rod shape-determining protein MreD [Lachnospiraceae bacterium]|jgi:rod shape-determining protein MreD
MRRRIIMAVLILVCFLLQSTVFQWLSIGSITPNLLLILTVSFGLMRGKSSGLWTGFFCGILIDLFYGQLIGFYALIYMMAGYFTGFCYKIFYDEDIKVPMVLVAASDLIYNILIYGALFLLRGRLDFLYYLRRIIIPEILYTVLLTLLLYRLFFRINQRLQEKEIKERESIWLRK